jgi:hypothetical protein
MGKKKRAELEKQKQGFIAGALKNGISKDIATSIFLKIEPFYPGMIGSFLYYFIIIRGHQWQLK